MKFGRGGFSDKEREGEEEEEREVNVLVLVWRAYEESVRKVRVSLEPEYKHTGGNGVCTPCNVDE